MPPTLSELELAAYLCEDVYLNHTGFEASWILKEDVYRLGWFESQGVTVAIVAKGEKQYVVFRGTNDILDWLRNLHVSKTEAWPEIQGKVHAGFYTGWYEVRDWVLNNLDSEQEIVFCGHSLGGALAVVGAVDVGRSFPVHTSSITFAAPRVGNTVFAKSVKRLTPGKHTRVVLPGDVVPRIPSVLRGFRHAGDLIYLTKDAQRVTNPSLWRKWLHVIANWRGVLKAHSMKTYSDRLPLLEAISDG